MPWGGEMTVHGRAGLARKVLPPLYGAAALVLVAVILPSALRPPPDTANSSARYSPDAPPDKKADAIIKSVQQAGSKTAGNISADQSTTTTPTTAPAQHTIGAPTTAPPPPPLPSRAGCFGSPPRQIESVYSVPCQPAFTGDNGGSTAFGVTGTDINVILYCGCGITGEINDSTTGTSGSSTAERTLNNIRRYFNAHFELYGRQLRFFAVSSPAPGADEPTERSNADSAYDSYHPFAAVASDADFVNDELPKRKVVTFSTGQFNNAFHAQHAPYLWTSQLTGQDSAPLSAEYVCKRLKDRPPFPTGDPLIDYRANRTFGMLADDQSRDTSASDMIADLATCGVKPSPDVRYEYPDNFQGPIASAVLQFRNANVSTIIFNGDVIALSIAMSTAESNHYYPEWIETGYGANDINPTLIRSSPPTQTQNLFGTSLQEIPRDPRTSECFHAISEVDPGATPSRDTCTNLWPTLVQMVGAMQL